MFYRSFVLAGAEPTTRAAVMEAKSMRSLFYGSKLCAVGTGNFLIALLAVLACTICVLVFVGVSTHM